MAKIIVVSIVLFLIVATNAEEIPENNINITSTTISAEKLFMYFDAVYNLKVLTPLTYEITSEGLIFQLGEHIDG